MIEMCPCGCGYPVKRENGQIVVVPRLTRSIRTTADALLPRPCLPW